MQYPHNNDRYLHTSLNFVAASFLNLVIFQLICQLFSWFTFYCAPRTLSNSLEAAVTPIVLYYWLLAVTSSKDNR